MFKSFVAVALLAAATPGLAADPAAVAAATALVTQLDLKGQVTGGMAKAVADMRNGGMITRMLQAQPGFDAARAQQPAKFDAGLKKIGAMQADAAQKVVAAEIPNVVNAAIQSYATHYTVAELKGLSDFYRSPLGVAFATKQPLVLQDVQIAQQKMMAVKIQNAMQALGPQVQAELKKLAPPSATQSLPPK